jgi:hypothetical protein
MGVVQVIVVVVVAGADGLRGLKGELDVDDGGSRRSRTLGNAAGPPIAHH